ncbi:molybdopterin-guanine dinucleotide biosynthesis protein B [Tumebacillus algifaecis]|uniref:Molybdopterin-guanine dinucleotide biosynthesis protein B n=1 Tax=Tumebacillus algifaecis TaxID=1214604 RepID=A0A223D5D2_9BACL|nr:molybdopterin-guanine dinucleotide biosynthesis protein B [Tumebacillus algifaecis]ASS76781.1 molybdopterin-guanine dinucleotide biosynthesis protein B [Tumebacillus algifaecis]
MKALAVVGYKNSGKTTLVARLVAAFKAQGYRVGTCKHEGGGHPVTGDTPNTDTWRHRQAGADVTLLASATETVLRQYQAVEPSLELLLEQLAQAKPVLDLVIVEGWKRSTLPKIVMVGADKIEEMTNVVAWVQNCQSSSIAVGQEQVYDRDDIEALVLLIKSRVLHE